MAKEKSKEIYKITELAQREGYPGGKIDGKYFVVIPAVVGPVPRGSATVLGIKEPAKCFIGDDPNKPTEHKQMDGEYFEDLSFQQIHELYLAKVITLDKSQQEQYLKEVAKLHKPKE